MAGRKDFTYAELEKLKKHKAESGGALGVFAGLTGADYQGEYAQSLLSGRVAAKAEAREKEYEAEFAPTVTEHQANLTRMMETERQLALQQAQGKLGFAQSSGPGTAGRWAATETALNREFNLAKLQIGERTEQFGTGFKLDFLGSKDRYDMNVALQRLQFRQQQALMQQQAELNSASWWEQLGGIVGFGLALAVPGGGSVAAWGLGKMFGGVKDA